MIVKKKNKRFTVMVAGRRGVGKSSFLNTLVGTRVVKLDGQDGINIYMLELECEGVKRKVSLVDTPGFGDTLDDSDVQNEICKFIRSQFDMFMVEESKVRRNSNYEDTRVHCLVYMISSTSAGLKDTDVAFLKKISGNVNIIPVISKADGLTISERLDIKRILMEQMRHYSIPVFDLDDPEIHTAPAAGNNFNSLVPFLVVSPEDNDVGGGHSNEYHQRGRVNINNPNHSDVPVLRELILTTHLSGLIDYTASELYEKYRASVLENKECESEAN